jgi:hypothetical protein
MGSAWQVQDKDQVWVARKYFFAWLISDIVEMVAAMTEGDPGIESEIASHNIPG